jgi:MoxR-like ATPase
MQPENYIADSGLVDACNVALLLGQPLLLTGEPGTGKTQFAASLAWELGYPPPLKFETKSTSIAGDLFYHYDTLKRFQDAQNKKAADNALPYLTYHALGAAILRTQPPEQVAPYLPAGFTHPGQTRSVVLIDEVDKAPRDFPNDLLNELEQLYFRIPELDDIQISANPAFQPIIIITSNSEKDLPDAFLRRCIYYNIPFPNRDRLQEIVTRRLGAMSAGSSPFLDDALNLFDQLRALSSGLRKKPATAELLGWLLTLQQWATADANPFDSPELVLRTLGVLVKTAEDQERATQITQSWLNQRQA